MGDESEGPSGEDTPEVPEGIRIIRPEEAAERVGKGNVARRKPEGQKFGDRPSAPEGPRPTLRFPLSDAADPTDISRPRLRTGEGDRSPRGASDPNRDDESVEGLSEEVPAEADEAHEGSPAATTKRSLFSVPPEEAAPSEPQSEPPPGPDDTGTHQLPHWTEPATGEVPRIIIGEEDEADDEAWEAFAAGAPRWRDSSDDYDDQDDLSDLADDEAPVGALDTTERPSDDELFSFDDLEEATGQRRRPRVPGGAGGATGEGGGEGRARRPAGQPRQRRQPGAEPGAAEAPRTARRVVRPEAQPQRTPAPTQQAPGTAASGERNVPLAVAVGVLFGGAALILFSLGAKFALALVVAVLVLSSAELFTTVRRAGYQPAHLLGITACVAFPLAAYWRGEGAYPLVLFLTVVFLFLWYLAGAGDESPVLNSGVTLLGVAWVGGLGGFAALFLRGPDGVSQLLAVVIAVVAFDVGAFFVGRSFGQTPLSEASPHKSWEGVAGGALAALLVSVIVIGAIGGIGVFGESWTNAVLLALVVSVAGTIGDLSESLLKRDLGVKDMGSILPGHGGLLDRFDGLLFALPTAYYLALVVA